MLSNHNQYSTSSFNCLSVFNFSLCVTSAPSTFIPLKSIDKLENFLLPRCSIQCPLEGSVAWPSELQPSDIDMLRLRPSEITLTPADVEETRRRMARKQAATTAATVSSRVPRAPAYPQRGPRLRRGPDRSRDDAVLQLGAIPILAPQQAIRSSADDDTEPCRQGSPGSEGQIQEEQNTLSPVRDPQLPLRPAPGAGVGPSRQASIDHTEDEGPSSPKHQSELSRFGRTRTNPSEDVSETRLQSSVDGVVESSPHSGTTVTETPRAPSGMPTRFLRGYFVSPERYTFREYQMVPHTDPQPRARRWAPRTRTMSSNSDPSQLPTERSRQASGPVPEEDDFWDMPTAEPAIHTEQETPSLVDQVEDGTPRSSFDERIRRAHLRLESIQGRYRDFLGRNRMNHTEQYPTTQNSTLDGGQFERISEASSNSSLPYSFYELPMSRHSSTNRSGSRDQLPQSQYDGAVSSRQASQGAYYSIRPSQVCTVNKGRLHPTPSRVSSYSSPNLTTTLSQHGLSPLPSSPYRRGRGPQNSSGPSMTLVTSADFVGEERDAASAAERNLPSPLDLVEQRAVLQLAQVSEALATFPSRPVLNHGSFFQHQIQESDDTGPGRRRGPSSSGIRQESGNAYHRLANAVHQRGEIQSLEPTIYRTERTSTRFSETQPHRRGAPSGRSGQRSSENVPVGATSNQSGSIIVRPVQGRTQRTSFGHHTQSQISQGASMRGGDVPSSPIPSRFSIPQASSPRDLSNRVQERPHRRPMARPSSHYQDYSEDLFSSNPISPSQDHRRSSRRNTSGTDSYHEVMDHQHQQPINATEMPRFYHERRPPPMGFGNLRHSSRVMGPVPPSLNSRRPPIPARVASRRISAQQQNQENSGDAEAALMREEMAAVDMRYADDEVGLDIMDETPPRMGRFERHMMGN